MTSRTVPSSAWGSFYEVLPIIVKVRSLSYSIDSNLTQLYDKSVLSGYCSAVRGYILYYLIMLDGIPSQVPTEPIVTSLIRSKFSLRGGYVAVAEDPLHYALCAWRRGIIKISHSLPVVMELF